jgi:glutathione S-transferase
MTNKNLTVYGDYLSQPFRSIICFCKLANIDYDVKFVNLGRGEHLTEDFKKINPYGKIPCIVLKKENGEEFKLAESCSILRFLAEYYKIDNNWYPKDPFRRALVNQWLDWHHSNTRFASSNYAFRNVFGKRLEQLGVKVRETYDTTDMIPKVLGFLDKILSKRKFIVDDEVSIADLILVQELNQLHLANYDFSNYEKLDKYMKNVNSIKEVKEVNNQFENIAKKIKLNFPSAKF